MDERYFWGATVKTKDNDFETLFGEYELEERSKDCKDVYVVWMSPRSPHCHPVFSIDCRGKATIGEREVLLIGNPQWICGVRFKSQASEQVELQTNKRTLTHRGIAAVFDIVDGLFEKDKTIEIAIRVEIATGKVEIVK